MDRLEELLKNFSLEARVFQSGALCRSAVYDAHSEAYIHILEAGRLRVSSDSHESIVLSKPSVFVYMKPTAHRLEPLDEQVSMVCASFDFGGGFLNPVLQGLPAVITYPLVSGKPLQTLLTSLFFEARETHCDRRAVLDRLMEVVVIYLLRALMDEQRIDVGVLAGLADKKLVHAIQAMHSAPAKHWTLDQLAQLANMSRARIAAHFHACVGVPPATYLTTWRMSLARRYLSQDKPIPWIAEQVGYSDSSAFSRMFKKQVGESPRAWREKLTS